MGLIVYRHKQYYIQKVYSGTKIGYILANNHKVFADGHSHLNNFNSAKYVLYLATKEKIPENLDIYRMYSLYRILEDGPFRDRVLELIKQKEHKAKIPI